MKLLISILMLISFNLLAKEEVLAIVTNDENSETYKFILDSDENLGDVKAFYKDNYLKGTRTLRTRLESKELTGRNGLILEQRGEHKVIALKSDNFDRVRGGMITIDTLFNGAKGERHEYEIQLSKDRSGWKLFKSGRIVNKLHIEVNKVFLIGTVGVKNIRLE
jgi:hypothetical protein